MKKALIETFSPNLSGNNKVPLMEAFAENGRFFTQGVIQRADSINKNRRVYRRSILVPAIDAYMNVYIKENRAFGELDHPDRLNVEGKYASHTMEDIWWKGNDVYGKNEVLNTPNGNIVQTILNAKKTLGISSRAAGSVTEYKDYDEVEDDLEFVCWDYVTDPSVHFANQYKLNESTNLLLPNVKIHKSFNKLLTELINDLT